MLRRAVVLLAPPVLLMAPVAAQATWTNRTTASTPAFASGFALAYDSVRNVLVLFGGETGTGPTNDTWEWDGVAWTLHNIAIRPNARSDHAMAFDAVRGVIVMCGGFESSSTISRTTYEYDGSSWVLRHFAPANEAVAGHRMAFDPNRGQVIRFGGNSPGTLNPVGNSATHAWTGTTWTLLTTGGPSPRMGQVLATDELRRRVVLFGGSPSYGTLLDDTWEWTGTHWQQRFPAHVPPARWGGGLAWTGSGGKLALFGGTSYPYSYPNLGDTWTWNGSDWTQVFSTSALGLRLEFGFTYDAGADCAVLIDDAYYPSTPELPRHWEFRAPVAVPASFTTFGTGCAGSAGVPRLAAAPGSLPFLGDPFTVRLTGIPGSYFNPAFLLSGVSTTTWNGAPLPQDLGAYGMPGCYAWIAPAATEPVLNLGGVATKTWIIPLAPAFVGVEFHCQGAVLDPWINAASFALSNAGTVRIGQV